MRTTITIIILLVWGTSLPAQQDNKDDLTRLFNYYCSQELFTNASNLLVEKSHEFFEQGDTLTAYDLQLKNCHLTDEHLEEFFQKGLSWEGYFSNWYITISWAAWLGKEAESSKEFLRILEMISQKEPKLLPFYASSLGFILYKYKTDKDNDSIFVLQKALDYIKDVTPSHDIVKQYNDITDCFYTNRFYNSFENNHFYKNHFDELEKWYLYNRQYINLLDTTLYKQEILDYELLFIEQVMLYASTINSQAGNPYGAIEMYSKAISTLEPLVIYNDTLSQKIAACYSHLASIYYSLGENALCKDYSDRALPYLINHKNDLDYCDILSALSLSYYNINQHEFAAKLKKEELTLRDEIGWNCSLTDWGLYFLYIIDSKPYEVISLHKKLCNARKSEGGNASYFLLIGKAYSKLMDDNESFRDTADYYFDKVDSILLNNNEYYEKYNLKNQIYGNLNEARAEFFSRLREINKSYEYSKKALSYYPDKYYNYYKIALKSAILHDLNTIHAYLPRYYYGMEEEILNMLPILGSLESDTYLGNGENNLYHIPEWASWNPTDSISVSIAYDAALLMKGITLRYNVLTPYYEKYPELVNAKLKLDNLRDSIYSITDENIRLMALHQYQIKEREILKEVNSELTNVHWEDISRELKDNEACIEFVKYTKNAYSWSEGTPKPHYAALILHSNTSPIFVDLFDEDDLMDVYNLQPKSYDTEMGTTLFSKLWGNLAKYIEGKNSVYFSPIGLLNLINIENLMDISGITALEKYHLYRVSSTKQILDRKNRIDISSVASFGGIDYKESHEYAKLANTTNTRGNWDVLQNTLSEVYNIKEYLNNKGINVITYTGKDATENEFKILDGTQSNIIHIATHGYYITHSQRMTIPYFVNSKNTKIIQDELFYSGLVLSGGQKAWIHSSFEPNNDDGILSSYEISKLDFHNVDLVVLSACESGLGDNLYDGIFGLQRAFKKAGVKSILMSLWQIDDKATSEYMSLFYKNLSEGSTVHDAYTSTILEMKQKYPDPYYWAAFVLLD